MDTELRVPPQSLHAERSVLGCILLQAHAIEDVCDLLRPEMFYSDFHATTYRVCLMLFDAHVSIDAVSVAERLGDQFAEIGGVGFIAELMETVPGTWNARLYASIVRDRWIRRELVNIGCDILRDCYADQPNANSPATEDTQELLQRFEQKIFRIVEQQTGPRKTLMADLIGPTLDTINARIGRGQISGLSTGFRDLDSQTNGFNPGQLIVIGARPSMGKTAFVCNIAEWVAGAIGATTALFSLEQERTEVVERLVCIRSRLDGHRLKKGAVDAAEKLAISDAARELSPIPLHIDDEATSVTEIAAACRRWKRREGLGLIIVDYLQLVDPEDRRAPREQQISANSRRFKRLAKELHVPVVLLSQLNRGVDLREDKCPRLADLRESGAIEQDADIVLLLHRPDAYNPDDQPGIAEVIVAKQRSGPTGVVRLAWRRESMRFTDVDPIEAKIPEGF